MLTLVKEFPAEAPLPIARCAVRTPSRQNDNRRRFLAQLRDDVAVLRAVGLGDTQIAGMLNIEVYDVRAFCPKPREKLLRRNLPRRAVEALLHGRYAPLGGRTVAKRSRHLVEIASAYTWDELMSEPGVGTVTASEIKFWLEERGETLKKPEAE